MGEGPFYDDLTGRVGWVDILGSRVLWRDLATGDAGEIPTPAHVGAAVPRTGGGFVLCLPDGPVLADPDGTLHVLDPFPHVDRSGPAMRANDAKADPAGRLWLGTMAYDETPGAGALYRLDPGRTTPVPVLENVTIANGLGWSPDGTTMYFVDTPTNRVDAFDYDLASGTPTGRRTLVETEGPGGPDGLCVDARGGIWVAFWGGAVVRRYRPDGSLDRVLPVPAQQTSSCAFAGPDLDQLVITTASTGDQAGVPGAGQTYVHVPGDVVGQPVDRYAG